MPDQSVTQTPPRLLKACRLCGSNMPASAVFCKECENYQSTIRRLFAGLDVSGWTGLVSSAALAFAFLNTQVLVRSAEVNIAPLTCENDNVRLAVQNSGTRAAVIQHTFVTRTIEGKPEGRKFDFEEASSDPIILPQQGRMLILKPKGDGMPAVVTGTKVCYAVEIVSTEFNGQSATSTKSCPCA